KQSVTGSNPVQRTTLIFPRSLLRTFFVSAPRPAHTNHRAFRGELMEWSV
ncbi:hypothetical protein GY502_005328, partial [Escherichia coli]|nr:hypothetical protein [Escherichia coli]